MLIKISLLKSKSTFGVWLVAPACRMHGRQVENPRDTIEANWRNNFRK